VQNAFYKTSRIFTYGKRLSYPEGCSSFFQHCKTSLPAALCCPSTQTVSRLCLSVHMTVNPPTWQGWRAGIVLFSVQLGPSDKLPGEDHLLPTTCLVYCCSSSAVLFAFVPTFCFGDTARSKRSWRNSEELLSTVALLGKNGKCFYFVQNLPATSLLDACLFSEYICVY
jgi:hypothetical protein